MAPPAVLFSNPAERPPKVRWTFDSEERDAALAKFLCSSYFQEDLKKLYDLVDYADLQRSESHSGHA